MLVNFRCHLDPLQSKSPSVPDRDERGSSWFHPSSEAYASLIAADNGDYRETLAGEPFGSPLTGGVLPGARPEGSQSVAFLPCRPHFPTYSSRGRLSFH